MNSHAVIPLAATPLPEARILGISTPQSAYPSAALVIIIAAAVIITGIALYARSRARRAPADPADRALISLAQDRGFTRADVDLLRKLAAAHGRVKPVALLLAPSALASARGAIPEKSLTPAERKRAERIATVVSQQWLEIKGTLSAPSETQHAA